MFLWETLHLSFALCHLYNGSPRNRNPWPWDKPFREAVHFALHNRSVPTVLCKPNAIFQCIWTADHLKAACDCFFCKASNLPLLQLFDYLDFHILGLPRVECTSTGLWLTLGRHLHLCCVCGVADQQVSIPACVSEATPRLVLSSCAR